MTGEEHEVIRGFAESEAISPRFVRRVLEEYGEWSVKAAFLLRGDVPGYWLDYLLRSRNGRQALSDVVGGVMARQSLPAPRADRRSK